MRNLLLAFAAVFFTSSFAFSADVACSCKGADKCSDVLINFVPSNPGVYMTIEYAYGERDLEGFATITTDSKDQKIIYRLGNFTLVKDKDGKYSLPLKQATCD